MVMNFGVYIFYIVLTLILSFTEKYIHIIYYEICLINVMCLICSDYIERQFIGIRKSTIKIHVSLHLI